jgi:hypothetical protein
VGRFGFFSSAGAAEPTAVADRDAAGDPGDPDDPDGVVGSVGSVAGSAACPLGASARPEARASVGSST